MFKNHIKIFFLFILQIFSLHNILDYGAIPNKDTIQAQNINSRAIQKAIYAANSSFDRIVIFPNTNFYIFPVRVANLYNITIYMEGKIIASKSFKAWPNTGRYPDLFEINNSDGLHIRGGGKIDGRGYHWWTLMLLNKLQHERPNLFGIYKTKNIIIHDLILKNSPFYHIKMDDVMTVEVYNLDIKVNTTAQINLIKYFSLQGIIPMFPFNTDGIDPFGKDMHFYNITCQNWDDVIVPKPARGRDFYSTCTQNILAQNITVKLGVGMSIGSVPPKNDVNCVRNVTFRNVYMDHPFKGIYIKTNPGTEGSGIIDGITYQNFTMKNPIWWAIYIGPQQMKEPDGGGPGCLLYPFDPKGTCQTQPRVSITNILLQNISISNSLLYPVTIRCNVSNPCKNFTFENVNTNRWDIGQRKTGVVCQYASGIQINSSPSIFCFDKLDSQNRVNLKQQQQKDSSQLSILRLDEIKLIWQRLQAAAAHIGYQQQDDQMTSIEEIIKQSITQVLQS